MSRSLLSVVICLGALWVAPASANAQGVATDRINFDGLPAGAQIDRVYSKNGAGPIRIRGFNPSFGSGVNAALTFDSSNPTGGDDDLGSPNQTFGGPGIGADGEMGMPHENATALEGILIVGENFVDADNNGLVDDPDDADVAGTYLELDFAKIGPVQLQAIRFIDGERDRTGARVEQYDKTGMLVSTTILKLPGDNGVSFNRLVPAEGADAGRRAPQRIRRYR